MKRMGTRYERMTAVELDRATREFDREWIADKSRPLVAAERRTWQRVRRKPGRPRRGAGVKVVSVSVERGLLARADAVARQLRVSRAALVERGLRMVLGGEIVKVRRAKRAGRR